MTVLDLGINTESINYEVALEALGQARQPLMEQIRNEGLKTSPCAAYIDYCTSRLAAIDQLQAELEPADRDTIHKILNGGLSFPA